MNLYCAIGLIISFIIMIVPEIEIGLEGILTSTVPLLPLFVAFITGDKRLTFAWACCCIGIGVVLFEYAHPQKITRDSILVALCTIVGVSRYI